MALFRYKAVTADGEIVEGQYDVASNDEVIAKIQDAGNIPLEVSAADGTGGGGGLAGLFKREAMNQTQVLQFTQQLATLLGAGQPLDRALQILLLLYHKDGTKELKTWSLDRESAVKDLGIILNMDKPKTDAILNALIKGGLLIANKNQYKKDILVIQNRGDLERFGEFAEQEARNHSLELFGSTGGRTRQ